MLYYITNNSIDVTFERPKVKNFSEELDKNYYNFSLNVFGLDEINEYIEDKLNDMKTKSLQVYEEYKKDIESGCISLITNAKLVKMGIKGLFEEYKESNKYLFDIGELHAIALAKAMGIVAFVSDDTKDEGPHQTLVKELIQGVIPFAFYELLFLKYLHSQISVQEMFNSFEEVNSASMKLSPD